MMTSLVYEYPMYYRNVYLSPMTSFLRFLISARVMSPSSFLSCDVRSAMYLSTKVDVTR